MANQFDAASKHIIDTCPADWIALSGLPTGTKMEIADTDLSVVSAAADKLIRVASPDPYVAHIEFQAGPDAGMDGRVLVYNSLARRRTGLPVRSVVFLLRPQALAGAIGRVSDKFGVDHRLDFEYKIIKVWELPPESLLKGGVGTLALAPISAVQEAELPALVETMKARLDVELDPQASRDVWLSTRILMGLRYSPDLVRSLVAGISHMKESTTYQEIIAEGRTLEAREALLRRGRKTLGEPDSSAAATLYSIGDYARLEVLMDRLLDESVNSWSELLAPSFPS